MRFLDVCKGLHRVCVIVLLLVAAICYSGCSGVSSGGENGDVKLVNENYPTEIIVYGDIVEFDHGFVARYIDSISIENLTSDEKYMFSVLVINDLEGNAPVSDEEMQIIKEMFDEENLNLYYFGTNLLGPLKEYGFYSDTLQPTDMSIAQVHEPQGSIVSIYGIWNTYLDEGYHTKNSKLLGQGLIRSIVYDIIKMNL
jgi:hypothetical protein